MMEILRRFGILAAFVLVGVYAAVVLRGPQGVQALFDKQKAIGELQQTNATLRSQNVRMVSRIEELKNNPEAQEIEIRKRLKRARPNETEFILPESQKPAAPALPAAPAPAPSTAQ